MNITVYLGANEGNDPCLRKAVRDWGHGLETVEMHLFMVVLKVV